MMFTGHGFAESVGPSEKMNVVARHHTGTFFRYSTTPPDDAPTKILASPLRQHKFAKAALKDRMWWWRFASSVVGFLGS
jgi:hypothetical protein